MHGARWRSPSPPKTRSPPSPGSYVNMLKEVMEHCLSTLLELMVCYSMLGQMPRGGVPQRSPAMPSTFSSITLAALGYPERREVLRGSISAVGTRWASFLTRAPPVTF